MEEFVKKLLRRSDVFFKNALSNLRDKEYDLAMFNLEQSLQLFLKVKILEKGVEFPGIHEIDKLLYF